MRWVLLVVLVSCTACPPPGSPPDAGVVDGALVRVEKAGDGTGVVTSDPAGIDCDTACAEGESFVFPVEVGSVTLVAEPARDALFEGWTCTGTKNGEALDSIDATTPEIVPFDDASPNGLDITCTASFKKITTLQVIFAGAGSGRVVGTLTDLDGAPRLSCPGDCTSGYFVDEVETLSATADEGSVFAGWAFCATGTADITIPMSEDQNCEARFDLE